MREERPEEAEGWFHRALELAPGFVGAQANFGHCLLRLEDSAAALKLLDAAHRQDPSDARVQINLASAYRALGQIITWPTGDPIVAV